VKFPGEDETGPRAVEEATRPPADADGLSTQHVHVRPVTRGTTMVSATIRD
jgi:hypothetical protein